MTRLTLSLSAALLCCASLPALATPQAQCHVPKEDEILALYSEWNERLKAGNPTQVAELYMDDALLLPTVSAVPRQSRQAHVDYFEGFLRDQPEGTLVETHAYVGCNEATLAGLYRFKFAATGNEVPARFTFNYRLVDGKWLIAHHHSSLQPTK
jgi:uncharacterized protein (TIGR02246 family)